METEQEAGRAAQETPTNSAAPVEAAESPASSARETATDSAAPQQRGGASGLRRRSAAWWALTGGLRLLYRWWTRIAARVFPEESKQARWAVEMGIPLPDRLNMSWVTPQLAVGGRVRPNDIGRLARSGVTAVVDTRSEHQDDEQALGAEGIRLLYLPTPDTHPLTLEDLRRGSEWVNERLAEGDRVLIHCEHGVGRSVLLTAASLVAGGMPAHDAVDLIQRRRWQAAPNHRQIVRLQEFERDLRATQPSPQ